MKNFIGYYHAGKDRKKIEKLLNKKKSVATLTADLQKVFNTYIRIRDTKYDKGTAYFICISCNKSKDLSQMNAGHFFAVGNHPALRFDEDNCHGQCIKCNCHLHGNLIRYQGYLIKKIGQERFNALDLRTNNRMKLMSFELELLIDHYKKKIEDLKKGVSVSTTEDKTI